MSTESLNAQNGWDIHQPPIEHLIYYLAALLEPDDLFELRLIGNAPPESATGTQREFIENFELIARLNREGRNVYAGPNPRASEDGRSAKDVKLFRAAFVDFDGCDTQEAWRRIEQADLPQPTLVVASSAEGAHAYWRFVESTADAALWRRIQRGLIDRLGSDPKITDPPRIMRVPGFDNRKREVPFPCRLMHADATLRYPVDAFPQLEEKPVRPHFGGMQPGQLESILEQASAFGIGVQGDLVERCRRYLAKLPDSVEGRNGSAAMFRACCEIFRFGLDDEQAWAVAGWFNAAKCFPQWSESELVHKLADAKQRVLESGEFGNRVLRGKGVR